MSQHDAYHLDESMRAFVEKSEAHSPDGSASSTAADRRRAYDALCAAFDVPVPEGLTIVDECVPGPGGDIPVRRYSPAGAAPSVLVLYMHGGGFVVGGLDSHHSICAELCAAAGCDLVSVDYRLAPEFIHPAQTEDCLAAFRHYAESHDRIVVAGDSAGGTLAAALCLTTRMEARKPAGAVLIYPALGGDRLNLPSFTDMAYAPLLTAADMRTYTEIWLGGRPEPDDPSSAPLLADDFAGHPPTAIFSAAVDPLCDDGAAYAFRLVAQGVPAVLHREAGLVHGYLRARRMSEMAGASFARICAATRMLAETGTLPAGTLPD